MTRGAMAAAAGGKGHLVQRILHLLQVLEERHMDIGQAPQGWQPEGLGESERRQLELAWESVQFMDEIPGGFFIYYAEGDERLIYANKGVLRIFGCESLQEFRELTGDSFKGLVYPDDLEAVEESIRKQIAVNQYDLDYVEYRIRRKDGVVRWVEDYGHFIHAGEAGDIFYVFLGDPTDERSQEQMRQKRVLAEALDRADLAVKAKNAFLSQISHEMRTPLNAIFGFITLAKTSLDDTEAVKGYLGQMEVASRQLLDMITHALDMSSLTGAAGAEQEECDLRDTLQEVYEFLLPQAQEKGLRFTLDCGKLTHRTVYTNPGQLKQLVLNLANNAITYTEKGSVDIVMAEEKTLPDSYAVYRLEVRDTGVGISEEFLEKAFEPFSRDKASTLSGIRGIGLGLTIAKSIADLLEGTIEVKSQVDKGSTFSVMLPFHVQPLPDVSGNPAAKLSRGLHILLAEDNELNREIETELLQRMGFIIDPAADGKEAWDKVRASSAGDYDLAILDLQMPLMDGWQVASAIRGLPDPTVSRLPLVALSANVSIHDRRRSLESGIDEHLTKPMDLPVLLATIEKLTKKAAQ